MMLRPLAAGRGTRLRAPLLWLGLLILLIALAPQAMSASDAPDGSRTHGEAAAAHDLAAGHSDPIVPLLFVIVLVLVAAKLGGDLAARIGQPQVLGELLAGVVIGNLGLIGLHAFDGLKTLPGLELLAGLGVILLLFEVGLESTIADMMKVGASSFLVASLGVATPFFMGWGVAAWLLPEHSTYVHVFVGATLCATSVGITARVLQDLRKSRTREARIILGAAVIDDVMGLVVLAVMSGLVQAANTGQTLGFASIARTGGVAVGFLIAAIVIGHKLAPRLFYVASILRAREVLQATALVFCFLVAGLAGSFGLAPIVGAFAAGLLLEEVHYKDLGGVKELEEVTRPLIAWLAPFFFVHMGMSVDLSTFGQLRVLGLAAAITIAAVIGKQVCALGVLEPGLDRLSVGLGMIPRGEVGLIFAQIGSTLEVNGERLVDESLFAAVVIMVILTTVVTPGLLKWSFARGDRRRAGGASAAS